jgi:hypothetical protein
MAKKIAGSGAPVSKGPALSAVEREAQEMLTSNDEGEIDNVFDILEDMTSIEERLPANSALRPAWDAFHEECMQIVIDSAKE